MSLIMQRLCQVVVGSGSVTML